MKNKVFLFYLFILNIYIFFIFIVFSIIKGKIVAFDKIPAKIEQMKQLCQTMNADECIECYAQDSTKIDLNTFKPGSFDRVLIDAPCSALGQRPLIYNDLSLNQLSSYAKYQQNILDKV